MNPTYQIKMRTALWAIMGVVCFASAPAMADECQPYWTAAYKCMQGCGPCGGVRNNPGNDDGAARRAQEEAATAAAERKAEAERIERARLAEEKRENDARFIRERDEAAITLRGSPDAALSQLKGLSGTGNTGLKESGFDKDSGGLKAIRDTNREIRSQPTPHTDTSVVDARVPRDGTYLIDQIPELKNSPEADSITKGFQAVIKHNWPVALAWWQGALQRDPGNEALKRSVDLAQWMVDRRRATAAGPVTLLGAAIHSASQGNNTTAISQFKLAKAENPAIAPQADMMITALRERQAKDAKVAAYWSREIEKQTRQIIDGLRETGMNRLSIGDEKGAQVAFRDADFYSMVLPDGR